MAKRRDSSSKSESSSSDEPEDAAVEPESAPRVEPAVESAAVDTASAAAVSINGASMGNLPAVAATFSPSAPKAPEEQAEEDEELADLKQQLVDNLYGTEKGLRASSEVRAEIAELLSQLEARTPITETASSPVLGGKWKLAYTTNSELWPLFGAGKVIPGLTIEAIYQNVDVDAAWVENKVVYRTPVAKNSYSVYADIEPQSDKRVQVKFKKAALGKPDVAFEEIPEKVDLFGTQLDVSPLRTLLAPLESIITEAVSFVAQRAPFEIPIDNERAQGWLLTTYLDNDLRISRGDLGSLYVLVRPGSTLDNYLE
eukprot:jgi/Mesvir1/25474/Mv01738-RA.1